MKYSAAVFAVVGIALVSAAEIKDIRLTGLKLRVTPSVVAVRSKYITREETGTGVILCGHGHVLTASEVVPPGSREIRVYGSSGRIARAERLETFRELGLSVIQINDFREQEWFSGGAAPPSFRTGDVPAGTAVYVCGNSNNSLTNDLRMSVSRGHVLGSYLLREQFQMSHYTGKILEISSASDWHLRGAPVFDRNGFILGVVTINMNPARFMTCAIPSGSLKRVLDFHDNLHLDQRTANNGSGPAAGLGFTVAEKDGSLYVDSVEEGSSAAKAGITKGQKFISFGAKKISNKAEFDAHVAKLQKGVVFITIEDGGEKFECQVKLE